MRKWHISQRMCLFLFYGSFIVLLLSLLFACIYTLNTKSIFREAAIKQANITASVSDSVKDELDTLSTLSLNLVYSNAIRQNFSGFASTTKNGKVTSLENFSQSRDCALAIYDVITAMIGPFQSASQVNLYTMDGTCVGSGYQQSVYPADLKDRTWYEEVMQRHGAKYITRPMVNARIPASGPNQDYHRFLSMTRLFFRGQDIPEGVVEVVQDCNTVFSLAAELETANPGLHLYIYNERGELMYPYLPAPVYANYEKIITDNALEQGDSRMVEISKNSMQMVTYTKIPNYKWTVVTAEPQSTVYAALSPFRTTFFLMLVATVFVTLLFCFYISKRLTQPLHKLTHAAKKLTISRVLDENKPVLTSADSSIREIAELCTSFREMYGQLRVSSKSLLLARSEEIRADLQATQSLINPHFLYNSLAGIGALAEDGMNDKIVQMCDALCDYFRYISASAGTLVPLKEEIEATEKYVSCMQIRFEEALRYTRFICAGTETILIPKLIVQPLVENAFKYGFNDAPPWCLTIRAYTDVAHWYIEVQDSGGSLTEEQRRDILQSFQNMDYTEELKKMKVGGMGLKNIYLRLSLLYGRQAVFKIENESNGKTVFCIGGPIQVPNEGVSGNDIQL